MGRKTSKLLENVAQVPDVVMVDNYKTLVALSPDAMLKVDIPLAVGYLRQKHGFCGLDNIDLYLILKNYRSGNTLKRIAEKVGCSYGAVKSWIKRAVALHLVPTVTKGGPISKTRAAQANAELKTVELQVEAATKTLKKIDADLALAIKLRERAENILDKITPEKIESAKLKDQVDSLARLVTIERLLCDKSTSNVSSRSIIEHIETINYMTSEEKERIVSKRRGKE